MPRRLAAFRGALRRTMTETVSFADAGAGFASWSSVVRVKGVLSLPGRTMRGAAVRVGRDFFFAAMWFSEFEGEVGRRGVSGRICESLSYARLDDVV